MYTKKSFLRLTMSITLSIFTTLGVFGITLSLLWKLTPEATGWEMTPEEIMWKIAGALAAAVLALCAGGFVLAWSSGKTGWAFPAGFGLLFGGLSFIYIMGPVVWVLLLAAACALAAAAGGQLYRSLRA